MQPSERTIGIDIGGTKIAVGLVDARGRIEQRVTFPTQPERGFNDAVERISNAIEQTLAQADLEKSLLVGIGIGCTGPVNPVRGTIHNPYTLPGWDDCDIITPLAQRFQVPVRMENDADAAAVGECFAGAGQDCDPVIMLTFGTGIGGSAIVRGKIYRGVRGEHPEFGHIPALPDGPSCYCGINGCFESLVSGTAIGEAGKSAGFENSCAVFTAATQGHAGARKILDRARQATATATWTILHTFMPERIILGGGIMDEHFELFAPGVREQTAKAKLTPAAHITVVKAALGNDAGIIGAARLTEMN